MKKVVLHLCADIGSDTYPFECDGKYQVVKIGKDIGIENVQRVGKYLEISETLNICIDSIVGVFANPPCTEFSTARTYGKAREDSIGMELVDHCRRIVQECDPQWWVIENPATGTLKNYLGEPTYKYEPWHYGSPWTKQTALWGNFKIPEKLYTEWERVPKNGRLYVRPGRPKPSLACMHKSAIHNIPEFVPFIQYVNCDMNFRSLCSQGFAKAFKEAQEQTVSGRDMVVKKLFTLL